MKSLKTILGLIYPILIVLLLLNNCKGSGGEEIPTPPVPPAPMPEPFDEPIIEGEDVELDTMSSEVIRQAEVVGSTGALKITLLWDFHADIDLHVKQPNETEIFFQNRKDVSTGGYLDVDNREGGTGAAENIYWENPPHGQYLVGLHYYGRAASSGRAESGICTIVVFLEGREPMAYHVNMSNLKDFKEIVTINVE